MDVQVSESVVAYLSRLTGETLAIDTPLRLRSVQRAAFASWARKQQVPLRLAVISSSVPFSVMELLSLDEAVVAAVKPISAEPTKAAPGASVAAVGIDIEEVENLPAAADYREHAFYADNFTPAEISYCVRQANVLASFCGLWAAKEAILKAGVANAPNGYLKVIEIFRDSVGRPTYPGCSLSISHTARTAVAICNSAQAN